LTIKLDGSELYSPSVDDDRLYVIDTKTNMVTHIQPVGKFPRGVGYSSEANKIYQVNVKGNSISIIDATSYKKVGEIDGLSWPYAIGNFITQ
jgi:YVTN family beta-propeller protein